MIEVDDDLDLETAALNFIENEVGRIDWRVNWTKMRESRDMLAHVTTWLQKMNLRHLHDPREVVQWIDDFVENERGAWR